MTLSKSHDLVTPSNPQECIVSSFIYVSPYRYIVIDDENELSLKHCIVQNNTMSNSEAVVHIVITNSCPGFTVNSAILTISDIFLSHSDCNTTATTCCVSASKSKMIHYHL